MQNTAQAFCCCAKLWDEPIKKADYHPVYTVIEVIFGE